MVIEMIPIEWLCHHPDNPRLELGDLSELTESIRANGVMQNLTVVPAMDGEDEVYHKFWVLIGNRRFEAAKAAGLKELPCVLSDMDRREQMATMLQENMQRADLTLYEQARGIQMMIDLGFTREQVAERTGFSKTTIDRRLQVASLPDKETKSAVGYGYDLVDLCEIAQIKDAKTRKELLTVPVAERADGLNVGNLRHRIKMARQEEERRQAAEKLLTEIRPFAKEMKNMNDRWSNKYEQMRDLSVKLKDGATVRKPTDGGNYWYWIGYDEIEIYRKKKAEPVREKSEFEVRLEKKQKAAKELNQRMSDRRTAFVRSWTPTVYQWDKLRAYMYDLIFRGVNKYTVGNFRESYHSWEAGTFRRLLDLPVEEGRDREESLDHELKRRGVTVRKAMLAWMLSGGIVCDSRKGYCNEYSGKYEECEDLDIIYDILEMVGYIEDDEEKAWRTGTHEVFGGENGQ